MTVSKIQTPPVHQNISIFLSWIHRSFVIAFFTSRNFPVSNDIRVLCILILAGDGPIGGSGFVYAATTRKRIWITRINIETSKHKNLSLIRCLEDFPKIYYILPGLSKNRKNCKLFFYFRKARHFKLELWIWNSGVFASDANHISSARRILFTLLATISNQSNKSTF